MDYMKIHCSTKHLYTLQNSPFLIFITGNCLFFLPVCGVTLYQVTRIKAFMTAQ